MVKNKLLQPMKSEDKESVALFLYIDPYKTGFVDKDIKELLADLDTWGLFPVITKEGLEMKQIAVFKLFERLVALGHQFKFTSKTSNERDWTHEELKAWSELPPLCRDEKDLIE